MHRLRAAACRLVGLEAASAAAPGVAGRPGAAGCPRQRVRRVRRCGASGAAGRVQFEAGRRAAPDVGPARALGRRPRGRRHRRRLGVFSEDSARVAPPGTMQTTAGQVPPRALLPRAAPAALAQSAAAPAPGTTSVPAQVEEAPQARQRNHRLTSVGDFI